jgi:hypothetical protein
MIIRAADGTLSYTKADGTVVSAGIFDEAKYAQLEEMETVESGQELLNQTNLNNYNRDLANAQESVDTGRSAMAPTKPVRGVLNYDTGKIVPADWVPPLKDLVQPATPNAPSSGLIAVPTVNEAHLTYLMVKALYAKQFPGA